MSIRPITDAEFNTLRSMVNAGDMELSQGGIQSRNSRYADAMPLLLDEIAALKERLSKAEAYIHSDDIKDSCELKEARERLERARNVLGGSEYGRCHHPADDGSDDCGNIEDCAYHAILEALGEGREDPIHSDDIKDSCELKEAREKLEKAEADTQQLKEAISPGRIADLGYYIGVATRMRSKETRLKIMDAAIAKQPQSESEDQQAKQEPPDERHSGSLLPVLRLLPVRLRDGG